MNERLLSLLEQYLIFRETINKWISSCESKKQVHTCKTFLEQKETHFTELKDLKHDQLQINFQNDWNELILTIDQKEIMIPDEEELTGSY